MGLRMLALLAVVAGSPLILEFAIGGQVVIETAFSRPGMGKAGVEAALRRDCAVARVAVFLLVTVVIGLNFVTELTYNLLDPCIRLGII